MASNISISDQKTYTRNHKHKRQLLQLLAVFALLFLLARRDRNVLTARNPYAEPSMISLGFALMFAVGSLAPALDGFAAAFEWGL